MTNENYTNMSNQELWNEIYALGKRPEWIVKYLEYSNPMLLKEVLRRTDFLDKTFRESFKKSVPITARLYCLKNDLSAHPKCGLDDCENFVKWDSGTQSFRSHCCAKHSAQDERVKQKRSETNMTKYGHVCPLHGEEIRKKVEETNKRKFGVANPMQSIEVREKAKRTNMQRLGVDNPSKSISV